MSTTITSKEKRFADDGSDDDLVVPLPPQGQSNITAHMGHRPTLEQPTTTNNMAPQPRCRMAESIPKSHKQ